MTDTNEPATATVDVRDAESATVPALREDRPVAVARPVEPLPIPVSSLVTRIKVAYSVSVNMPDDATEGSLVIATPDGNWTTLLPANSPKPLTVLVLGARSYWKEWLTSDAFTAGNRPKVYATKADAIADGQTVEWGRSSDERPSVAQAVDVYMLVKRPENTAAGYDSFNLILDGEPWALCVLTVDKAAAPKVIAFLGSSRLRDASSRKVPLDQGVLYHAFCTLCVRTTPAKNNPARKYRLPTFAAKMTDKYEIVKPTESFLEEAIGLLKSLSNPGAAAPGDADDPDDLPF